MVWLSFFALCVTIIVFGWLLAKKSDELAERKQWGKGIVGFILLGFATSLPELVTTLSSVIHVHNADLGAGNILGSNFANFFILFISLISAKTMRRNGVLDVESISSLAMFLLMLGVYGLAGFFDGNPRPFGFSIWGAGTIVLFIGSVAVLHRVSKESQEEQEREEREKESFVLLYLTLLVMLVVLVAASWYISEVVDEISRITGWNSTSVGALFLAWATSLPELVVTISAMIIGASEMAIGNITGSITFNLMVLGLSDLFARKGMSLFHLGDKVVLLILFLLIDAAVLLVLLTVRSLPRILRISVWPAIMAVLYIVGMLELFV